MRFKKIGIIGFGNFGKLLAAMLRNSIPNSKIVIFDKNLKIGTIKKAAATDLIFIAVPISEFASVVKSLKTLVKPPTVIVDVCSVKVFPLKVMRKNFIKGVLLIATHPLFGPSTFDPSGKNKIVVSGVNSNKKVFASIMRLLNFMGLEPVEITPQNHDRLIARSQVFLHLVTRIATELDIKNTPVNTKNFDTFLTIQKNLSKDSWQLFIDMFRFNHEARLMMKDFRKSVEIITRKIETECDTNAI